jgi:putative membrane protein
MRRQKSRARNNYRTVHVIAGIAGGLVASFAMERFQRALGQITPEVGGVPGGGGQQYRRPQSEIPTYKAADVLSRSVSGEPVSRENKPVAASAIHYAFGGAVGAIYGAATVENPDIAAWGGVPFGASVWLIADEMGMPLVGLAKPPSDHPLQDHAATFASHLVYGVTTEAVRRLVLTILHRSR